MEPTDATIGQKLVGTWIAESKSKWHFVSDGSWSHDQSRSSCGGTWQVIDRELLMTMTSYAGPPKDRSPVGQVLHCMIVRVDDQELVWDLGEATTTLKRHDA